MKLAVIGGGVTGLATAHRVVELAAARALAVQVVLLEARDRLGGTIATERADGFIIETGPDSFLSDKPWALALCQRLGIEDRLLGTDDRFRRALVWHGGRLHPLPEGFQLLAPTQLRAFLGSPIFSWRGKLRMALDLVLPRGGGADESLGAFVRRRLGAEALDRVAQPLVAGIYTADPNELSLAATMPRFVELERRHRSVILGLRRNAATTGVSGARWSLFVTFRNGMEELVTRLSGRLPVGTVRLKQRVDGLTLQDGRWRLTVGGERLEADQVVIATEAHAAGRMLRYVHPALATLVGDIPYASSATLSLAYRRDEVPHPLDAFGFVVPRAERRAILACTFSSVKYPGRAPASHVLLRCFVGGALDEAVLAGDDAALVQRVREELRLALGVTASPRFTRLARHPRSMPQYHVGHLARVETIERRLATLPGLFLAGGAYRGVGIADCVHSGEIAAERVLDQLTPPTRG